MQIKSVIDRAAYRKQVDLSGVGACRNAKEVDDEAQE